MNERAAMFDSGGLLIMPDPIRLAQAVAAEGVTLEPADVPGAWNTADAAVARLRGSAPEHTVQVRWLDAFARALRLRRPDSHVLDRTLHELDATASALWSIPAPGAYEAMTRLRSDGWSLAVVGNAPGTTEQELTAAGLREVVDVVVDSSVVAIAKPNPRIYRLAASRLGLDIRSCCYVGHERYELQGAIRAGVAACIGVGSRWQHEHACDAVTWVTDVSLVPAQLNREWEAQTCQR